MSEPTRGPVRTHISFAMLRQVAEAASGTRDAPTWYVRDLRARDPGKRGKIQVFDREPIEGADYHPGALVIEVSPEPGVLPPPPPLAPSWGKLGFSPEKSLDLMDVLAKIDPKRGRVAADSVFWTESAVEKFVVPYYASLGGPGAETAVREVLEVLHRRSPHPRPPGGEDQPQPGEAFALVHIPTSEYFQADLVKTDLLAVVLDAEGTPAAVTLAALEETRKALGWPE